MGQGEHLARHLAANEVLARAPRTKGGVVTSRPCSNSTASSASHDSCDVLGGAVSNHVRLRSSAYAAGSFAHEVPDHVVSREAAASQQPIDSLGGAAPSVERDDVGVRCVVARRPHCDRHVSASVLAAAGEIGAAVGHVRAELPGVFTHDDVMRAGRWGVSAASSDEQDDGECAHRSIVSLFGSSHKTNLKKFLKNITPTTASTRWCSVGQEAA